MTCSRLIIANTSAFLILLLLARLCIADTANCDKAALLEKVRAAPEISKKLIPQSSSNSQYITLYSNNLAIHDIRYVARIERFMNVAWVLRSGGLENDNIWLGPIPIDSAIYAKCPKEFGWGVDPVTGLPFP